MTLDTLFDDASQDETPLKEETPLTVTVRKKGRPSREEVAKRLVTPAKVEEPKAVLPVLGKVNKNSNEENPAQLNDIQKAEVDKMYAREDITSLARRLFNDESLDGRSAEAVAIKNYIIEKGNAPMFRNEPKPPVVLSDDQKQTIRYNLEYTRNPLELANFVFAPNEGDKKVLFGSREYTAVFQYTREINRNVSSEDAPVEDKEFRPPNNMNVIVGWANRYVPTGDPEKTAYPTKTPLKPAETANLRALMSYMKTHRFIYQADKYKRLRDRELFISTFVRWCHDKPDLTPEEVDQYIGAASETVNIGNIERFITMLEEKIEEALLGDGNDDAKVVSLKYLDLMNQNRAKLDTAKERLKKLLDTLVGSRSDRLKGQIARNQSVVHLVSAWQNEERRREIIALAEKEQGEDAKEYEKIRTIEDMQALVAGLSREEAITGL
jgi:hypothetical protein